MALKDILGRAGDFGLKPAGEGRWMSRCPAHDDRSPSLSITRGTGGRALVHCHAGCTTEAIVTALGLALSDLFDGDRDQEAREKLPPDRWPVTATYEYQSAAGEPVFRVLRKTSPDSGAKTFRQERRQHGMWAAGMDGVDRVLYNLPRLADPETADDTVFLVEGERDADALTGLGLLATTNPGGAGKWLPQYNVTLKGRHVVILPDNDKPGEDHAKLVSDALNGVAASVRILRLSGLPPKGDVSDWVGTGGTAEQLRAAAAKASRGACFMPSSQRLDGERAERLENAKHLLPYGISFLDEALGGIMRRDLILIGALTGRGKTKLASNIALVNCRRGKRVHYFALEAEDIEIERRMKYELIATAYYKHAAGPKRIRYLDWYNGKLDYELGQFEKRADEELRELLKNLNTFYRMDSFTSEDFSRHLTAIQDETDLVILDHFHYVDSDEQNENKAQKKLIKQIRDSALKADRPVIVIGHVRKSDARYAPLVPTEEAFSGTKDLANVMTKGIMIAPDNQTSTGDPSKWSTFMQIVKCRQDSSLSRFVARMVYDTRTDSYESDYSLGRLIDGGREYEPIAPYNYPHWKHLSGHEDPSPEFPRGD